LNWPKALLWAELTCSQICEAGMHLGTFQDVLVVVACGSAILISNNEGTV
jgi:hypothetical protein